MLSKGFNSEDWSFLSWYTSCIMAMNIEDWYYKSLLLSSCSSWINLGGLINQAFFISHFAWLIQVYRNIDQTFISFPSKGLCLAKALSRAPSAQLTGKENIFIIFWGNTTDQNPLPPPRNHFEASSQIIFETNFSSRLSVCSVFKSNGPQPSILSQDINGYLSFSLPQLSSSSKPWFFIQILLISTR